MEMVHPFFKSFKCWSGPSDGRYHIDFLGVKTDPRFAPELTPSPAGNVESAYPEPSPEIFEWITTVGAARNAKDRFVMAQIGGGWGAWLVRSGVAIRNKSNVPFHLIGVETDPQEYLWMRQHFADNGIDPDAHALSQGRLKGSSKIPSVKVVELEELFRQFEVLDVLYIEIQEREYEALKSSLKALNKQVRRVFIKTHAGSIDGEVEQLFRKAAWLPRWIYQTNSTWATYWGLMEFPSGCQVWLNKALLS